MSIEEKKTQTEKQNSSQVQENIKVIEEENLTADQAAQRLSREARMAKRAAKKAQSEAAGDDVDALKKEIKNLGRELKREKRASKSGEAFEKELLAQREEFDAITDTNMVYAITNKELVVEKISRAFTDMFGYTAEKIINEKYAILIHIESHEKFFNGCEYVSSHGKEAWGTEIVMQRTDGSVLYTHTFIYPLFESGVLKGFTFVSSDISTKRLLQKLQIKQLAAEKYHQSTLDFITSTSAAVLDTVSYKISAVVKLVVGFIFLFLVYAFVFEIDEISRGGGKFIPTSKVQHIKNYEGGVVSSIYVQEGDSVKKGQILLKFSPISHQVKLDENKIRLMELKAKELRLKAEATGIDMDINTCLDDCDKQLLLLEESYYRSNKLELSKNLSKQMQKLKSQESVLSDSQNKYDILNENFQMLNEEFLTKKELEKKRIFTKYEIRTLERELNDASSNNRSAYENIIQVKSQIKEIKTGIEETKLTFSNKAASKYNETISEILRLEETRKNLTDIIKRTIVISPVDGVVKELFVHTLGTSVQSSAEILTIVPDQYEMIAEVKMKPEEIAKLHIGQAVKLKVTAFDYSIYGDLSGKITNISPDTIIDKETGDSHYLIYIKTKKSYLNDNVKYKIKVGMMVNADILVGKKTIMSYLLKPILKTTQRQ